MKSLGFHPWFFSRGFREQEAVLMNDEDVVAYRCQR